MSDEAGYLLIMGMIVVIGCTALGFFFYLYREAKKEAQRLRDEETAFLLSILPPSGEA